MRWMDSVKEAISMSRQQLSRAVRTGHGTCHLFRGPPGVGANSTARNTHIDL